MHSLERVLVGAFALLACQASARKGKCDSTILKKPEHPGTSVVQIQAREVKGYPFGLDLSAFTPDVPTNKDAIDFCNVTVTYTHPGLHDSVNVYVWLPLDGWNGNYVALGGSGWAAGLDGTLAPAVAGGYAASNTDAGCSFWPEDASLRPDEWAMPSPGVIDHNALQNFASVALGDMVPMAKAIAESYYGKAPKYSYWNGCSTGGRQGLLQAQRFPENFDGILAVAPAINWADFVVLEFWGVVQMNKEKYYPPPCEFSAISEAAIDACDGLDGVKDGMVAAYGLCKFDALSAVGRPCCDGTKKISKAAAKIANAVYEGPKRNGVLEWFGHIAETQFASAPPAEHLTGLLHTICDDNNDNCTPAPFPITKDWVRLFLAKDPEYDPRSMTEEDLFKFLHISRQQYTSIISTNDPDLSGFKKAGGKMITWHGGADRLIPINGSANYYERVLDLDPEAFDFYRYFEAPGAEHCVGRTGALPHSAFQSLVDWVEKGEAPTTLDAAAPPTEQGGPVRYRILCPYPQVAAYVGGDPNQASSFKCADNFGTEKVRTPEHNEL